MLQISSECGYVLGVSLGLRSSRMLAMTLAGQVVDDHYVQESEMPDEFASQADCVSWVRQQANHIHGQLRDTCGQLLRAHVALPTQTSKGGVTGQLAGRLAALKDAQIASALEEQLGVPVQLGSDAELALAGSSALGLVGEHTPAVLFAMSTALTVATRTQNGSLLPRSAALGDFAILDDLFPAHLLCTSGLACEAAQRGIGNFNLAALEEWEATPGAENLLADFISGVSTAVRVATVTTDPAVCVFTGRLAPLVDAVLPRVREQLAARLTQPPQLVVASPGDRGYAISYGAAHTAAREQSQQFTAAVVRQVCGEGHPSE